MSTLIIRNLEPAIKDKLCMAAAAHGRSMEEEVRTILRNVLAQPAAPGGLGSRIQARFAALGGVEFDLPARVPSDQTRFTLSAPQMKALNQALDAPARELPGLKRLFAKLSVFPAASA